MTATSKVFLPDLVEARRELLRQAGVPIEDDHFGDGSTAVFGTTVTEESLPQVLQLLGASEIERRSTVRAHTFWVELKFDRPHPCLVFTNGLKCSATAAKAFAAVAQEVLGGLLQADLVLEGPVGHTRAPYTDEKWHILFHSGASEALGPKHCPPRLFDVAVHCRDAGFAPGEVVTQVLRDPAGVAVGEQVLRTAYMFHNGAREGSAEELKLFRKFCEELAQALCNDADANDKRHAAAKVEGMTRAFPAAVAGSLSHHKQLIASARTAAEDANAKVTEVGNALRKAVSAEQSAIAKLTGLVVRGEQMEGIVREQLLILTNHPKVECWWFDDTRLHVRLKHLYFYAPPKKRGDYFPAFDGGAVYRLGVMRVVIDTSPRSGETPVWFYNETRSREGMWDSRQPHPQVKAAGTCCWGDFASPVSKSLGAYQFGTCVTELLIKYLEGCNNLDWDRAGQYHFKWPKVESIDELFALWLAGFLPSGAEELPGLCERIREHRAKAGGAT